jgi:hypothetical protein
MEEKKGKMNILRKYGNIGIYVRMILIIGKGEKILNRKSRNSIYLFKKEEWSACVCERKMAHHVVKNACIHEHQVHAFGQRLQD